MLSQIDIGFLVKNPLFLQLLMKLVFSLPGLRKETSNTKFYENPSTGSRLFTKQTDRREEIVVFHNFANVPEDHMLDTTLTLQTPVKSHLSFAGIIRSSPYSPR
jgi:hypothetical protein